VPLDLGQQEIQSEEGGENYRRTLKFAKLELKAERNYRMMENAYQMLPSYLPLQKVEGAYQTSRSREQFVEKMILFAFRGG